MAPRLAPLRKAAVHCYPHRHYRKQVWAGRPRACSRAAESYELRRIQMLTCPVCRSQNMETAKFCGNCGNPFPRPSMPTSSLINCPQGHVYSAVYQFCPYCPQPEPITQSGPPSEFATRVEEPVTALEPPTSPSSRLEPYATNFETRVGSSEIFETRIGAGDIFETRVGSVEVAEMVQPQAPP